jgi:hypothetical protein
MAQPTADDINGLYTKYLGRSANPDETANWLSGNYGSTDLSGIEGQISTSGEAQAYQKSQGASTPPAGGSQDSGTTTQTPAPPPMNYGDPSAGSGSTAATPPPAAAAPAPAKPSYDDINGLYTKYLGRPATQDEYGNWINGTYGHTDLSGISTQIQGSGEGQAYAAKNLTPNSLATFTGFDPSRLDSNTLKYNAMSVLQSFNPNDPNAMSQAYAILNQKYPGQYQLDSQGNLMLTGTADGYIGARPIGWGSGGAWQDPNGSNYDWQWMAYNPAHPGPKGEGTGTGTSAGTGTGAGSSSLLSSLSSLLGLGKGFGGPGSAGVFGGTTPAGGNSNLVQQIGQDPFSLALTGALTSLLGTATKGVTDAPAKTPLDDQLTAYLDWAKGKTTTPPAPNAADAALTALLASAQGHLNSTPQEQAAAFEKARMPYEMARKVQLGNAGDQLANRGLLSESAPGGGQYGGAVDRIETNLAPSFTAAVDNAFGQLTQNEKDWGGVLNNAIGTDTTRQTQAANVQQGYGTLWGNAIATGNTRENQQGQAQRDWGTLLTNAANAGTTRQNVLGTLAINELAQNNQFTEFLANYGLDRDKAMADIAQGQGNQLLQAFALYLQYGSQASAGFV